MSEYSAGAARAEYILDASAFYAEVARIKREYAQLRQLSQQAAGAQTVIPASAAPAARNVTPIQQQAIAQQRLAVAQNQAAASAQRLAQAQIQTAITAQRQSTASAQTAAALSRQTTAAAQAQAAQLRLSQAQARAGAGLGTSPVLPRTIAGLSGAAASAAGAAGVGLGVGAFIQGAAGAAQYTTALTQTENVLRQLSGSQERYNTLTRIAAENQKLFGGTLAENYAPLTGVLALSNQTGASLDQLNGVTQLLLAKAPGKSAGDAFFGLGEFLSGKGAEAALSLADQFNLSKAAIAALAAEGVSAEQRLTGLTKLLAEQGVTAETLAARLTDDALAYNRLGAAGEQAYIRLGKAANAAGVPLANIAAAGLERVVNSIDRGGELQKFGGDILAAATSYEEYGQIVAAQNAEIRRTSWWEYGGQQLPVLTQAQYNYAKALEATGIAADVANRSARGGVAAGTLDNSPEMLAAQRQQRGIAAIGTIAQDASPEVSGLADRLLALAAAGGPVGDSALALATSYANYGQTAEQTRATLDALEAMLRGQRAAQADGSAETERAAASMDLSTAAASAQQAALADATKAAADAANAGGNLDAQARAAGDALLASGNAGAAAAALLAGSSAQVDVATAAYYRLAAAQAAARASGREGGLVGGGDTSGLTQAQQDRLAAEEAARYQTELQDRLIERTGTTAQRLALVNAELAKARPLSEEAMALEVERAQLNQQLAGEQEAIADRAASTAASAAKKAASEAKQLADQEQRERERRQNEVEQALERIEDRTADHYRRLRQAQEDYALSSSRREEDYQEERQRLLAEGRIAEAQQLTAEFDKEQRRAAEDAARARARQNEDVSGDIARIREDAQLGPADAARARAAIPAVSAAAIIDQQRQAQAQAILAASAGQQPALSGGALLRIEFAPIQLVADGRVLAEVSYPHIEQRLTEDLTVISATAPATGSIAGGGRP